MVKKHVGILLAFIMLILCMAPIASAEDGTAAVSVPSTGFVRVEAEYPYSTNIGSGHRTSQMDYVLSKDGILNNGCIAFVGKKTASYRLNVSKAGYYIVTAITGASGESRIVNLNVNAKTQTTLVTDSSKVKVEFDKVLLPAGETYLEFETTNDGTTFLYAFDIEYYGSPNDIDLSRQTGAYKAHVLPTKIEAEHFDLGNAGHISVDGKNSNKFRKDDGIEIVDTSSERSITLQPGEMTAYTFNVEIADDYDFYVSMGKKNRIIIEFDGYARKIDVKPTDNERFSDYLVDTVYLPKGEYRIKVFAGEENLELDNVRFASSANKGAKLSQPIVIEKENDDNNKVVTTYKTLYVSPNGSDDNDGSQGSPFASVNRAAEEVGKINGDMTGNIVVEIAPGDYQLTEKIMITPENSGKNGYSVIFRGADENNRSVLNGGVKVTGWEKYDDQIYRAPLDDVDDVRNLYINTYPATRAKSKYQYKMTRTVSTPGREGAEDGIAFSAINFPTEISNIEDVEMVSQWDWIMTRLSVQSVEDDKTQGERIFYIDWPKKANWSKIGTNQKLFYFENAMEFLDEPGEFYYNKKEKMIYYYPYGNEDLSKDEAWVAKQEQFVQVTGVSEDNLACNVKFENLRFINGACNAASEYGSVGGQSDNLARKNSGDTPQTGELRSDGKFVLNTGHLRFDYTKGTEITNCEIINMGGAGVVFHTNNYDARIEGNIIRDTSATGIRIGNANHSILHIPNYPEQSPNSNITVSNNVITRVAGEFMNNCGISVYYDNNIRMIHNIISETPYTGLSMGYGWEEDWGEDTGYFEIANNYLYKTMGTMYDGGAFYSLGRCRNSTFHDNYIDVSGQTGYYNDAGSNQFTTYDNVITNCSTSVFVQSTSYNTGDINVYDNYSDVASYSHNDPSGLDGVKNIKIEKPNKIEFGEEWPQKVHDIINNAGLESQYKNLADEASIPQWHPVRTQEELMSTFVSEEEERVNELKGIHFIKDYMVGGEGVGYHKTLTPIANNNDYRSEEVRLYYDTALDDYALEVNEKGEWMNYEINIPKDGEYYFAVNAKQTWSNAACLKVSIDDEVIFDDLAIANDSDWTTNTYKNPIYLTAGKHILKYEILVAHYSHYFTLNNAEMLSDAVNAVTGLNDANYDEGVRVIGTGHKEPEVAKDYAVPFTDISDHWAALTIRRLYRLGEIKGRSETEYVPNGNLTVKEAVLLSGRALDADTVADESEWYEVALEKNIISADEDVNRLATREDFFAILMRTYVTSRGKFEVTVEAESKTKDLNLVDDTNLVYILGAIEKGYVKGDENGNLNPKNNITRAEAAEIIYRIVAK